MLKKCPDLGENTLFLPLSLLPLLPFPRIPLFSYSLITYTLTMSRFFSFYFYIFISLLFIIIYRAEIDLASTPFSPILMLMYIVPGVSIVPMPLFRANVAFFDRKNGAYVKIWAIFTGGAAYFSPPGTHDRVSIWYPYGIHRVYFAPHRV